MRVEGIDLPRNKRVIIALTYLYGIGRHSSQLILDAAGVDVSTRVFDLTEAQQQAIRDQIGSYTIEGDLRRSIMGNIKRLQEIGSYRGMRHRRLLPVRGQRTRTNARTRRGVKKTVPGRGRKRGAKK
jgi:small subunit ribosomal protein S13